MAACYRLRRSLPDGSPIWSVAGRQRSAICKACVDVCERCQAECDKYQMDYCQGVCQKPAVIAPKCAALLIAQCGDREMHSHASVLAGLRQ